MEQPANLDDVTPRHQLPRLHVAQAQKELFVNEAFEAIDWLITPDIEGVATSPPALAPAPGQGWIVAAEPTGEWAGKAAHFAVWSGSGWRYHQPRKGQAATDRTTGAKLIFDGQNWAAAPTVALASGGAVQDGESRAAILALIAALRQFGIIL